MACIVLACPVLACPVLPPVHQNATAHWPINRVVPPVYTSAAAQGAGGGLGWCEPQKLDIKYVYGKYPNVPGDICPSLSIPADRLWSEMKKHLGASKMSHYVLNIGANDGIGGDPVWILLQRHPHLAGLAIEPGAAFGGLVANLRPFKNMVPLKLAVQPSTAAATLRAQHPNTSPNSIDFLKIDIDSCECQVLEELLRTDPRYYTAKIIQVEAGHNLPPPLAFQDRCKHDKYGQSASSMFDLFGCSVQAAHDVLAPHGYRLLQYDWPDAVFVHEEARPAFPCMSLDLEANYWLGYHNARRNFIRFVRYANYVGWVRATPALARRARKDPVGVLEELVLAYGSSWSKRPLQIQMGVAGTGVELTIEEAGGTPWNGGATLEHLMLSWSGNKSCAALHARANKSALMGNKVAWSGLAGCHGTYRLRCRPMDYLNEPREFPDEVGLRLLRNVDKKQPIIRRPEGKFPCA